jgi:hypothetical protein
MKKGDKLKNIEKANLILEQCYLKSKVFLKEGKRVKLSDDLSNQIDNIINNTIPTEINKLPYVTGKQQGDPKPFVGYLKYNELGSKNESLCKVYIIFDKNQKFSGQYNGNDIKILTDNVILLNLAWLEKYGPITPKNLVNTYNKAKEYYKDVLVHEITHALDPKINRQWDGNKNYNPSQDNPNTEEYLKNYLTHDTEVIAQSTTFFNRIITSVKQFKKEHGNDSKNLEMLNNNLDLLLQAFATNNFSLIMNNEFFSLMEGTIPNKLISFLEKISGKIEKVFLGSKKNTESIIMNINQEPFLHDIIFKGEGNELYQNLTRILFYKKYNPKAWKSFLTKLYNTVQEAKEIVNS